jgi:hypothetical protein
MRSGGGGSGGDCGFKSASVAPDPAGLSFAAAHPRGAEPCAGRTGLAAARYVSLEPRAGRGLGARGRGARCQRGLLEPGTGHPSEIPPAQSATPSAADDGGEVLRGGPPWGPGCQGGERAARAT